MNNNETDNATNNDTVTRTESGPNINIINNYYEGNLIASDIPGFSKMCSSNINDKDTTSEVMPKSINKILETIAVEMYYYYDCDTASLKDTETLVNLIKDMLYSLSKKCSEEFMQTCRELQSKIEGGDYGIRSI